jgi:hypothetical protein
MRSQRSTLARLSEFDLAARRANLVTSWPVARGGTTHDGGRAAETATGHAKAPRPHALVALRTSGATPAER